MSFERSLEFFLGETFRRSTEYWALNEYNMREGGRAIKEGSSKGRGPVGNSHKLHLMHRVSSGNERRQEQEKDADKSEADL